MEKLLLFIKHRLVFLWQILEWINGLTFDILYRRSLKRNTQKVFSQELNIDYEFRKLYSKDAQALSELINHQKNEDLRYFNPHGFDLISIRKQFRKRAFLMMGVFEQEEMIGYFFLRFFANKKCFVGRVIDANYRGRGVGQLMNRIMYNIAWEMDFRCLSTISRNNKAVMKAHANNQSMIVLKELNNDYLLVEFVNKD